MSQNNPNRTVNVSFGNSILISLNETQIKYICFIGGHTPERDKILELISYKVNADILKAVCAVVKKRAAFIKVIGRYEHEMEENILGELLTIIKVLDVLL